MKRLYAYSAVLVAAIASPVFAENAPRTVDTDKFCAAVGTIAKSIMTQRQAGIVLSEIVAGIEPDEAGIALVRPMAFRAFEVPAYRSTELRVRAILEFQSDAELRCYKGLLSLTK